MMLLSLFLCFFEIGAVSFGGGYAMISVIRDSIVSRGWLSEGQLLNMIAVAESTPGPIAVNMATFVGAAQAGILGSLAATAGVVLPSFLIILLISAVIRNFLNYRPVQAFLRGVRPCVIALILATALTLFLSGPLGFHGIRAALTPDWRGIGILAILIVISLLWKRWKKKKPAPILMILVSAALGLVFYGGIG